MIKRKAPLDKVIDYFAKIDAEKALNGTETRLINDVLLVTGRRHSETRHNERLKYYKSFLLGCLEIGPHIMLLCSGALGLTGVCAILKGNRQRFLGELKNASDTLCTETIESLALKYDVPDLRINPAPTVERPEYNLDFKTFGLLGIMELRNFITSLDRQADWPETRDTLLHRIVTTKNNKTNQPSQHVFPIQDLILLDNAEDLKSLLGEKFQKPLLCRSALRDHGVSLDDFWDYLRSQPEKEIDVYDYSEADPENRTQKMRVAEVIRHWMIPEEDRSALNLLDIENRLRDFYPPEIIPHDLERKVSIISAETLGRTNSNWKPVNQQFFLLSGSHAISSIHVDNAGQLTWILVLTGQKLWYFPRKIGSEALYCLATGGSQCTEGYEGGWTRLMLDPGDLLVMPPGCPHAVFTPKDSLAVGGHFYTAAHFGSSLRALNFQENHSNVCNEDLNDSIYETLAKIVDNFGNKNIATSSEEYDVLCNSAQFFENLDPASVKKLIGLSGRKGLPKQWELIQKYLDEESVSELPKTRLTFLESLLNLRRRVFQQLEER